MREREFRGLESFDHRTVVLFTKIGKPRKRRRRFRREDEEHCLSYAVGVAGERSR